MELIQAIILGLVQGFTEWLPISSSGHLILAQKLMNLNIPIAFDVVLHVGTLIAVIVFFWKDILKILKSLFSFKTKDENFKLAVYVVIGTIPISIIGFLFLDFFESLFLSTTVVGIGFLITGILLLLSKFGNSNKNLNWLKSLTIGIGQAISLVPGISRSGSTISVGLMNGVKKSEVFKYSFLLSIPAIIGASLVEYNKIIFSDLSFYSFVGMIIAAASGYLAIKIVRKSLLSEKFYLFAIYCFILGIIVLSFSF
jgi:undecaprenyl-diphosphatase